MVNPFGDFDFSLLDNPEFGEDAVREELIAPLLRALGYSASQPYQNIHSRELEHPFVYFGTVKKDITIIPDYVLERDGRPAWIFDAKAPREEIGGPPSRSPKGVGGQPLFTLRGFCSFLRTNPDRRGI